MPKPDSFDVIENQDRFSFDVSAYVLGRQIVGIVLEHDRVELYLDEGKCIAFAVSGKDIEIRIAVPEIEDAPPGRVQ
jgi:hypothetical protein